MANSWVTGDPPGDPAVGWAAGGDDMAEGAASLRAEEPADDRSWDSVFRDSCLGLSVWGFQHAPLYLSPPVALCRARSVDDESDGAASLRAEEPADDRVWCSGFRVGAEGPGSPEGTYISCRFAK